MAGSVYNKVSNTKLPCAHTVNDPEGENPEDAVRASVTRPEVPSGFIAVGDIQAVQSGSVNHRL